MIVMYNHPTSEFATGVAQLSDDGTVYEGIESTFGTAVGCVRGGVVYSTPVCLSGTELGHVDGWGYIYPTRDAERAEDRVGYVSEDGYVYDSAYFVNRGAYGSSVVHPFGHVDKGTADQMRAAGAALLLLMSPERVQVKAEKATPVAPASYPDSSSDSDSKDSGSSPIEAILFPISLLLTFGGLFLLVGNLISGDFAASSLGIAGLIPMAVSVIVALWAVVDLAKTVKAGTFKKVRPAHASKVLGGAFLGFVLCLLFQVALFMLMGVIGLGSRGANATGLSDGTFLLAAVIGALWALREEVK